MNAACFTDSLTDSLRTAARIGINKVSAISARFRGVFFGFYFAYWSIKNSYGANLAQFQL
jgi:hypothetical protein